MSRRAAPVGQPLVSLLARSTRLTDVLPHLHQRALLVTGGKTSVLFEHNPRIAAFQATSGFGLAGLPAEPWTPGAEQRDLINGCFGRRIPTFVADAQAIIPDLASWLATSSALLLPVSHGRHRAGLLVIGFAQPLADVPRHGDVMEVADAFLTTIELFRLRNKEALQHEIRELLREFSASLAATLNLSAGLDILCHGAKTLFCADRVSVWLHDRMARSLVLDATSDPVHLSRGVRVSAEDAEAPAATAMRRAHAEIATAADDSSSNVVTMPLRGWRRALGTIVLDGVRVDGSAETDLLERVDELGRQVSTAIESMQLLEAMIGSRVKAAPAKQGPLSEADREDIRRRSAQVDRLPALGVFVAGIAHELNNPLQGVLGHLELLRATGAFPKHLRGEVQTIYREADRAAKIVRNLLVFAGSRRLTRRRVSLNAVLQKVVTLRQDACRALDVEVVRNYDEKLPRVQSDPLLLHQVFLNMVMNAEHAIAGVGRPGRIEITTTVANSGDRIVATVRDTGQGIPPEELTRIFEPFYTTKEVGRGTGLGLAIAYGIVREHGGEISAANAPGGGAIFTVELPVKPARAR